MSLVAPRFELPLVDSRGRPSREWYKFLVQLAQAVGPSTTTADDVEFRDSMDIASVESLAVQAARLAKEAQELSLLQPDPPAAREDLSLLAWWP